MLNKLIIDSTNSVTDLCRLGEKYPTDKSSLNQDPNLHKHAYTAIYDMLFNNLRSYGIIMGEIGILDNNSMKCWREYFPNAFLAGFEYIQDKIDKAIKDNLYDTEYYNIDVTNPLNIHNSLKRSRMLYDILIDDSTHQFDDQINVINAGYKFVKSGGYLIIEDIFKSYDENRYYEALKDLIPYFSSIYFVEANHKNMYSPGW